MTHKYLEGTNGDKSSTRLYAAILLLLICVVVGVSFTFALFHKVVDGHFIIDLFYGLLTAFGVCITAGKVERVNRDKTK